MKLTHKLILSFLLVNLIAIGLAAAFVAITTATKFSQYLVDQRQTEFVNVVTDFYQRNGNWRGVDSALRDAGLLPPFTGAGTATPDPQPFALVDQNRIVIVSGGQYETGQKVKQGLLDRGIGIEVGGVVVGTVLITGEIPAPNSIEQKYIDSVSKSLLIAALGGTAIALFLGVFLARSFTRPIRDLTAATKILASGKLKQAVKIHSADELGQLASSFNKMSDELAAANQSRRQMTADIAHDLRNPLTVIAGYLESIQDGKFDLTSERLTVMQSEVHHLQRLVEDLRTLSLAESGELTLHVQSVLPSILLERVASAYRLQAEAQGVKLVVDADSNLQAASFDLERMEQVLGNLVSNALRYTPAGGEIHLQSHQKAGRLAIEVRDTGNGISPDVLEHIFERSFRGDPSRSGDESGLGLAIAKSIVELHGGKIEAASPGIGGGSTFTLQIPCN